MSGVSPRSGNVASKVAAKPSAAAAASPRPLALTGLVAKFRNSTRFCGVTCSTPAVKFRDGRRGNRVGHVGPIGQPAQYAGIDENSHYSYSPSLLRAASDTDTPQSIAAPNN